MTAPTPVSRGGYRRFRRPEWVYALALLGPGIALYTIFVFLPTLAGFVLSLTDYDFLSKSGEFIGLENYAALLPDPKAHQAFINSALMMLEVIPISIVVSFTAAHLLNGRLRGKALFRTIYFLPLVSSFVAVATIFRFVFWKNGMLNSLLSIIMPVDVSWLNQPDTAIHALSVILIWTVIPLNIVFYVAALQGVPRELTDAAAVDGANGVQKARHVSWPVVFPTTILLIVLNMTFVVVFSFDIIRVLTQGGPQGTTTTPVYLLYQRGIQSFDMASASAIGFALAGLLILITFVLLRVQRRAY